MHPADFNRQLRESNWFNALNPSKENPMTTLKAFQVDDCTWYAAETAEQAAQLYKDDTGEACDEGYPSEVSDEQLDKPIPEMDEDERMTGNMTTMRAFLDGPGFLATTEW